VRPRYPRGAARVRPCLPVAQETDAGSPVSLRWGAQNEHPGRAPACRVRLPEVAALLVDLPHMPKVVRPVGA
jgi:hypothetical protein